MIKPCIYLILAAGLAGTIACKKNSAHPVTPPADSTKASIYVLGTTGDSLVYWKDDTVVLLATTATGDTYVNDISIAGGHVYVSGGSITYNGRNEYGTPLLWTDGKMTQLPDASGVGTTGAVFANSTDVYVAGTVGTAQGTAAVVWKDGVASIMPDTGALAEYVNGIVVSGSDVYVSGGNPVLYQPASGPTYWAAYWKNGIIHSLDSGLIGITPGGTLIVSSPRTTGLSLSGSDVYVSGTETSPGLTISPYVNQQAMYWKNGTPVLLPTTTDGTQGNAVLLANDTVYVAGNVSYLGVFQATVWKNGVLPIFPLWETNSVANAIAVSGKDVYVAGNAYINSAPFATYWKNGVATHLGSGGTAYKIIVQ